MSRIAGLACVLLIAACGGGSGTVTETSAQTVASNSGDFPDLKKCPESGNLDHYLSAEQPKDANQYATDKKNFDDAKTAGANDIYIAVYSDDQSVCGSFSNSTGQGKEAEIYAIRFKDTASASSNFKSQEGQFHLSDSDLTSIKSAGGSVKQGSATGLGDNSTVIEVSLGPVTVYAAAWQNNQFEIALLLLNLPLSTGDAAVKKINGRIK